MQETNEKTAKSDGVNLNDVNVRSALAERIKEEINDHTATIYNDGFRWHLGASLIGNECKRQLWFGFRWVQRPNFLGHTARLFDRGHREEARHHEWLRGLGFTVWTHDESITKPDGTHPQLKIKPKAKGHFGGSLDGIVQFPERYSITDYAIQESKTSATGAKFTRLHKEPLSLVKPVHYAQNSIYGYDFDIKYGLYMCADKNNDDLCIKVEKLDFALAERMIAKAEDIVFSQSPPTRISESSTYGKCVHECDFREICHLGKPAQVNCRSCVNCSAVDNGEFYCDKWAAVIPRDAVAAACPEWKSITLETKVISVGKPVKAKNTHAVIIEDDIPY